MSPARITTHVHHSPSRVHIHRSPSRVHIHRSPSRVEIEEVKHVSPARVTVTRTVHSSPRATSPLRGFEEEELAESLKKLIHLENRLEAAKESLALRPNFTIHDAFKIFDFSAYGRVGTIDVKDAYASYGIPISLEEARLIVSRYDRDRDEVLRFDEFSDMFFPVDSVAGAALDDRSHRFPTGYYLTPDILDPVTRSDFIKVLNLTLDVENLAEDIRQRHSSRPLFNRTDAFDAINRFGDKFITRNDFADLLAKHRFFATNKELSSLMDRFDKNKDGLVSYSEFVDEITPHSPIRY